MVQQWRMLLSQWTRQELNLPTGGCKPLRPPLALGPTVGAGSWSQYGLYETRAHNMGRLPSRRAPNALAATLGGGPTWLVWRKEKGVKAVVSRPSKVGCMRGFKLS